jgi:hypothetical protein
MEVTRISATLRHSKEIGGSWKSLEIGAEATVDPREDWMKATAYLYSQLAQQFRQLWSQNGATPHAQDSSEGHQMPVQPSSALSDAGGHPEHYCQAHQTEYVKRTGKNGATFYSHRQEDGWHNEK